MNKWVKAGLLSAALGIGAITYASYTTRPAASSIQQLEVSDLEKMAGVNRIYAKNSETPEVIFIPQNHPNQSSLMHDQNDFGTIDSVTSICKELNKKYGIHSIIVEGSDNDKLAKMSPTAKPSSDLYWRKYQEMLIEGKNWNVYPSTMSSTVKKIDELMEPYENIRKEFIINLEYNLEKTYEEHSVWEEDGKVRMPTPESTKKILDHLIKKLYPVFDERVQNYFTPEIKQKLYDLIITERDQTYINSMKQCLNANEGPVVAILGASHTEGMKEKMDAAGIKYTVLLPNGLTANLNPDESILNPPSLLSIGDLRFNVTPISKEKGFKIKLIDK
jgi:hypothetical protein